MTVGHKSKNKSKSKSQANYYTNLDEVSGQVLLSLTAQETIAAITVKLEGESRTRLAGAYGVPGTYDPYARNQTQLEVHKLLYKIQTVFPSRDVAAAGSKNQYTLPPGQYSYPFKFKIPFNNDCINNNSVLANLSSMRIDMYQGSNGHVKKTLPPTLGGMPGEAEIQYYVKATVQRPAFYKENWRYNTNFLFFPIEPPRPAPNRRESFARVQHQFAPPIDTLEKPSLFRKQSTSGQTPNITPPSVSIEGRLPDPAIITCNDALPLRILINRLNDSPASLFLEMLHVELLAFSTIRAHTLRRNEISSWTILSTSNMHKSLDETSGNEKGGTNVLEVPPSLWNQRTLPNNVSPTFHTCNISRSYGLHIKVGLSWGVGNKKNVRSQQPMIALNSADTHFQPELNVQMLRMPCQVYSGVAPPEALLEAMSHRPEEPPPPMPARPPTQTGGVTGSGPTQTTDHIEPSPEDIPPDAPPSYEDAIAEDMAPVDGPRRDYQQNPPSAGGNEKSRRLFDEDTH
ncbi:uncharacterized protein KY384_001504 [Bacidia gigantensis]|uniref:uncharacterized protein n=1 Tax=Bacidia gigantensis TaxID=2732470 RepID=UPI001D041D87|nr:uncharacterized protein KY384_001504 [Bacidia gigantensis]KAG8533763.1 hypothetical protein KY384_001504 [Bacidia gigantensis]